MSILDRSRSITITGDVVSTIYPIIIDLFEEKSSIDFGTAKYMPIHIQTDRDTFKAVLKEVKILEENKTPMPQVKPPREEYTVEQVTIAQSEYELLKRMADKFLGEEE